MKIAYDGVLPHDSENVKDRIVLVGLHGLGGDGGDLIPCMEAMTFPSDMAVRCVTLQADTQPVTLNNGCVMPAWFDILSLNREDDQDEPGIQYAANKLFQLVEHLESEGEDQQNIFLVGFSQGGALALYAGLHSPSPLGGVVALSTYLPMMHAIDEDVISHLEMPIFMGHGVHDDVVFPEWGQRSCDKLREWGFAPGFHEYPIDHSISLDEINDISQWLTSMHRS